MDVTITVHNPNDISLQCLQTLAKNRETIRKIIIVDNASTDRKYLNDIRKLSDEYIPLFTQVSLAASWNIGISRSDAPFVLVSNDDIIFPDGWDGGLEKRMILQPVIGVLQPFNTVGKIPEDFPNNYKKRDYVGAVPVSNFVGCCFVVRRDVLAPLKEFDKMRFTDWDGTYFYEKFYPFGCEDQDFYRRINDIGYIIQTDFSSYVHHHTGETMKRVPGFETIKAKSDELFKKRWDHGKV